MAKRTNRVAWGLAAVLVIALLSTGWLLFLQLYPYPRFGPYCYWVARHRGRNAFLICAQLRFASLRGVDLQSADLGGADLAGADLTDANLAGANLRIGNLQGAKLREANLRGAILIAIDLRGADLRGADLTGGKLFLTPADLKGYPPGGPPPPDPSRLIPKLAGARYDTRTRWPRGFDAKQYGAIQVR